VWPSFETPCAPDHPALHTVWLARIVAGAARPP
jgi:hypothetical protein